jgi:hypothetical protein
MWMAGMEGSKVKLAVGWSEGAGVGAGASGGNHADTVAVASLAVFFRGKLQSELLVLLNLARYRLVLVGGDGRG